MIGRFLHVVMLMKDYVYFLIFVRPFLRLSGKKCFIRSPFLITPNNIVLGNSVFIEHGARIQAVLNNEGNRIGLIEIKDNVSIQQYCHITSAERVSIGSNCVISFSVSIQDSDHVYEHSSDGVFVKDLNITPTDIADGCFIGAGARILAGTTLGKGCVVGANSVVRGVFPSGSMIAGVPGVVIKRFDAKQNIWVRV